MRTLDANKVTVSKRLYTIYSWKVCGEKAWQISTYMSLARKIMANGQVQSEGNNYKFT